MHDTNLRDPAQLVAAVGKRFVQPERTHYMRVDNGRDYLFEKLKLFSKSIAGIGVKFASVAGNTIERFPIVNCRFQRVD